MMAWVKVPKPFIFAGPQKSWLSLEYDEDGDSVPQDLAGPKPWIVVPWVDPSYEQIPIAITTTGRAQLADALVVRQPGLELWNPVAKNHSWICPLASGTRNDVAMLTARTGSYGFYVMPLASLPPSPVGTNFPPQPLFDMHVLKEQDPLKVCITFIEDASGTKPKRTRTEMMDAELQSDAILHQALVAAKMDLLRHVRINESLGTPVTYSQRRGTILDVLAPYRYAFADVNVFCVQKYVNRPDRGIEADAGRRMFLIQDNPPEAGRAFARGLARVLGVTRPNLFEKDGRLTIEEILQMNATVAKILAARSSKRRAAS